MPWESQGQVIKAEGKVFVICEDCKYYRCNGVDPAFCVHPNNRQAYVHNFRSGITCAEANRDGSCVLFEKYEAYKPPVRKSLW